MALKFSFPSARICSRVGRRLMVPKGYCSSSYYVNKVLNAEWMKNDDSSLLAEFKRSNFLLFFDKCPLLRRSSSSSNYVLPLVSHQVLSKVANNFGFSIDPEHAALIDVIPMQSSTNDTDEEFVPVFALNIRPPSSSGSLAKKFERELDGELVEMRRAFFLINEPNSSVLLAKSQSLLRWAHSTKFCSKCAAPLKMKISKSSAKCTKCSSEFHPSISPVAITLVLNDQRDHALLVRQPRHPPGVFTAVAGFAEMGETIEETARREIAEEVGMDVTSVAYAGVSQPWPFPQMSLMCGFFATVHGRPQPRVDKSELEDADWFQRSVVSAAFANSVKLTSGAEGEPIEGNEKILFVPPRGTMAHELIKRWLDSGAECSLNL